MEIDRLKQLLEWRDKGTTVKAKTISDNPEDIVGTLSTNCTWEVIFWFVKAKEATIVEVDGSTVENVQ